MKKTLAAVLAAAMALSTATVAFAATNEGVDFDDDNNSSAESTANDRLVAKMGDNTDKNLKLTVSDGVELDTGYLAKAIDDGFLRATVTVTEGRTHLDGTPSVSVQTKTNDDKSKTLYTRLRLKVADNYTTGDTDVTLRVRFTVAKTGYVITNENGDMEVVSTLPEGVTENATLKKGDTYNSGNLGFRAKYGEITDLSDEVTITVDDSKERNVVIDGEELYNALGDDQRVAIWFDDIAIFEGKISSTQKDLNLCYNTNDVDSVLEEFPDVDFEFLTFKGAESVTRFVNTGTMQFSGDKNTAIYRLEDDQLIEQTSSYEDGIVTVKGVKILSGTWVIASEALPEAEGDEPVDDAPVVEPDSEAPAIPDDDEENPATGAC